MRADVTVIIPVFNRAGRIVRALESVAGQVGTCTVEIIVVDDASTDTSVAMVEAWWNRRKDVPAEVGRVKVKDCRVIRLTENAGPSAARNRGMAEAGAPLIAFLDSDDAWLENALDARVRALTMHPDLDWIYCDYEGVRAGTVSEKSFMANRFSARQIEWESHNDGIRVPLNFFECQLIQPLTQTSTLLLRGDRLGPEDRFDESLRLAEDWEFVLRLSARTRMGYIDRVLVRKHVEPDGLTVNPGPWFAGNVRAGEVVLNRLTLTAEQRRFVKNRITEDLYEWGYHLNTVGMYREARKVLWRALRRRFRWKTVKQLGKGVGGEVFSVQRSVFR